MSGIVNTSLGATPLSISGLTYGPLTQIVNNATLTEQELDKLTEQASSGLISQTYSGLGATNAATVLDVSPQISLANAQISEINASTGPITVAQNALSEIGSIASSVSSQLDSFNLSSNSASTVIAAAQNALKEIAGLLDTQDGEAYVFAGEDSGEPPVPDPNGITSSGFYRQIQSAVVNLSSNGASATFASVLSIGSSTAAGTSPFAAGLEASSGLPGVTLTDGEQVTTGIAANSNAFVTSTGDGTTSTGSYIRDILTGLASIASLKPAQASGSTFDSFIATVSTSLNNASNTLNDDAGVLGNNQTQLNGVSTSLASTITALTTQVTAADSVDTAATLTQLSTVQTALQSSYQLIASLKTLNLAYYL